MSTKKPKSLGEMNTAELRKATREFDTPETNPKPVKSTRAERAAVLRTLRAIKRRRGRPVVGKGAAKVLVTLERGLLDEAETYRKRHGLKRSQLLSQALREYLRKAG